MLPHVVLDVAVGVDIYIGAMNDGRDVRQGPDGYLYVLTEEEDAVLLRLEPVEGPI